jgi:hypothetical protein
MAFNISNFKSTFDKYGGPARPSLFEVIISKPAEKNSKIDVVREFSFFCKSINFPGVNIQLSPMTAVAQMPKQFPTAMEAPPINAIFMIDSDHQILTFFHSWVQRVLNYNTANGPYSAVSFENSAGSELTELGRLPYEVGYKDDYACRMIIRHYSTESLPGESGKYYEVILDNVFPYQLGDLDLAWETNDSFLTLPVQFLYDGINFSGARAGNPSQRINGGLLETLSDLAGFADTLRQTVRQGKITSIQDAVNRLNRVRNSYDNISGFFTGPGNGT